MTSKLKLIYLTLIFITEEAANDELLYDPKMDDEDEQWVKEQREAYKPTPNIASAVTGAAAKKSSAQSNTDAVLNCPACMCTVCLDCQK